MNTFSQEDIAQNKTIVLLTAILQIFVGIIFFLPLVCCKDSEYGKFYANQGLLLLIMSVATTVLGFIPVLGWIAAPIVGIAALVFAIMNAVNASKGLRKGIPFIGDKIILIK